MNKAEVLDFFSAKTEDQAKKNLYKATSCGAFIEFEENGIILGSIVEGSDEGTTTFHLAYDDITKDCLDNIIGIIEREANAIWKWANEVDENGLTNAEKGFDWPLL